MHALHVETKLCKGHAADASAVQVLGVLQSLGKLVRSLHERGQVHRDLKPDNLLFMMHSLSWRLLDLGIVERAGALPKI